MVKLTGVLSQLNQCKVLVIGDLVLDTYTIGKARRISPEAPVAVINVQREENRPGMCGNVVLNLISLGAQVSIVGRLGHDFAGESIRNSLRHEGVNIEGLVTQSNYQTPVKNRILADNQQIVRVDYETVSPLPESLENEVIALLPNLLDDAKIVAISDYGKGFLTKKVLSALIGMARERGLQVISDPKGVDFTKYSGSTLIKPNQAEAYAAANLTPDSPLELAAQRIIQYSDTEMLMVTRSEAGISLFHRNGQREDFPVRVREIKDVTGAGDTVLATLTYALANELPIATAIRLSNVTAGMAIERFGCARITLSELARRLLEEDVTNKVFDEQHIVALKAALKHRDFVVLSISGKEGMSSKLFSTIRKLAEQPNCELLLLIRDDEPDGDFVNLLASLHDVDFILVNNGDIDHLFDGWKPKAFFTV